MPDTTRRPFITAVVAVAALGAAAFASGCGGSDTRATGPTSSFVPPTSAPGTTVSSTNPNAKQWHPLTPGYQSVRQGFVNRGHRRLPHRRVFTVTDVFKEIDGVRAVLVLDQDFDGGEIAEQALDYLAEDAFGNVWYVGSYTESYEGGQFVNASDAWLSGVKGAQKGILVPADPKVGSPPFVQARVPGEGTDTGEVYKTGERVCVPYKCYTDVLVIREGSELKFYAPGVGGIRTAPEDSSGERETEDLVNLVQLSPQGLAELSREALRLDEHARSEASDVFGDSARATRTP
jgi:hypothetical protein